MFIAIGLVKRTAVAGDRLRARVRGYNPCMLQDSLSRGALRATPRLRSPLRGAALVGAALFMTTLGDAVCSPSAMPDADRLVRVRSPPRQPAKH